MDKPRLLVVEDEDAIRRQMKWALTGEKEGDRLIIDPVQHRSLLALLTTWESLEENFPEIGDLPPPA